MIGKLVSHYRIVRRIGAGGIGEVFEAFDLELHRRVAIKFLRPELELDPQVRLRMVREARETARLDHPCICRVLDAGHDEDRFWIAYEYLQGQNLGEYLKAHGPLASHAALDLLRQTLSGLAVAHRAGLAHRDISPANIFLCDDGKVKLLDFGLAKRVQVSDGETLSTTEAVLSQSGAVLGTPPYMSPEQLSTSQVDRASDVFSLGLVFHECLTGRLPFDDPRNRSRHVELALSSPQLRSLSDELQRDIAALLRGMLVTEPAGRYRDADEVLAHLPNPERWVAAERRQEDVTPITQSSDRGRGRASIRRVLAGLGVLTATTLGVWRSMEHGKFGTFTPVVAPAMILAEPIPSIAPLHRIMARLSQAAPGSPEVSQASGALKKLLSLHFSDSPELQWIWIDESIPRPASRGSREGAFAVSQSLETRGGSIALHLTVSRLASDGDARAQVLVSRRSPFVSTRPDGLIELLRFVDQALVDAGALTNMPKELGALESPGRTGELLQHARYYRASGLKDAALVQLDTLLRIDPEMPAALWEKARVLESMGRLDEAREAYRLALPRLPQGGVITRVVSYQGPAGSSASNAWAPWVTATEDHLVERTVAPPERMPPELGYHGLFFEPLLEYYDFIPNRLFTFVGSGPQLALQCYSVSQRAVLWQTPLLDQEDTDKLNVLVAIPSTALDHVYLGAKTGWERRSDGQWYTRPVEDVVTATRGRSAFEHLHTVLWLNVDGEVVKRSSSHGRPWAVMYPVLGTAYLVVATASPVDTLWLLDSDPQHPDLALPVPRSWRGRRITSPFWTLIENQLVGSAADTLVGVDLGTHETWDRIQPKGERIASSIDGGFGSRVFALDPGDARLRALHPRDGRPLWNLDLPRSHATAADRLADADGYNIVGTWSDFALVSSFDRRTWVVIDDRETSRRTPREAWTVRFEEPTDPVQMETPGCRSWASPWVNSRRPMEVFDQAAVRAGVVIPTSFLMLGERTGTPYVIDPGHRTVHRRSAVPLLPSTLKQFDTACVVHRRDDLTLVSLHLGRTDDRVVCLDAAGYPRWSKKLARADYWVCGNSIVYVHEGWGSTLQRVTPGSGPSVARGTFVCLDLWTGRERWRVEGERETLLLTGECGLLVGDRLKVLDLEADTGSTTLSPEEAWWKIGALAVRGADFDATKQALLHLESAAAAPVRVRALAYELTRRSGPSWEAWESLGGLLAVNDLPADFVRRLETKAADWGLLGWQPVHQGGASKLESFGTTTGILQAGELPHLGKPSEYGMPAGDLRIYSWSRGYSYQFRPFESPSQLGAPSVVESADDHPTTSAEELWPAPIDSTRMLQPEAVVARVVHPSRPDGVRLYLPGCRMLRCDRATGLKVQWASVAEASPPVTLLSFSDCVINDRLLVLSGYCIASESMPAGWRPRHWGVSARRWMDSRVVTPFLQIHASPIENFYRHFLWAVDPRDGHTLHWEQEPRDVVHPLPMVLVQGEPPVLLEQIGDEARAVDTSSWKQQWRTPLPMSSPIEDGTRRERHLWDARWWLQGETAYLAGMESGEKLVLMALRVHDGRVLWVHRQHASPQGLSLHWIAGGLLAVAHDGEREKWRWFGPLQPDSPPRHTRDNEVLATSILVPVEDTLWKLWRPEWRLEAMRLVHLDPSNANRPWSFDLPDSCRDGVDLDGTHLLLRLRGNIVLVFDTVTRSVRFMGPDPWLAELDASKILIEPAADRVVVYDESANVLRTWRLRDRYDLPTPPSVLDATGAVALFEQTGDQ